MTAEQKAMVHAHFEKVGAECIKEQLISADDIKNLKTKKLPTGENAPCFLACVLKKIGVVSFRIKNLYNFAGAANQSEPCPPRFEHAF